MAKKTSVKTGGEDITKELKKAAIPRQMTVVSFRTEKLLKEKAEAVFSELGVSTSAAINMFLKQVVRENGLPFQPSAQQRVMEHTGNVTKKTSGVDGADGGYLALEELWDELQ